MKAAIRYFSRGGNTAKLAEAVSEAAGVPALTTDHKLTEDVDILFLGSSVYAYGVDESVEKFIRSIDTRVGRVVNFSTAALVRSTYKQVGKLLKEQGIAQASEEFYCRGSFGPMHKGRPDVNDLKRIKKFTKEILDG